MLRVLLLAVFTIIGSAAHAETYRLVHAIGNAEKVIEKGLTKAQCEEMKREQLVLVLALGVGGSVTCLPDSLFDD